MSCYRAGKGPNPVDARVGRQLSHRRKLLGLTEESLAEALGLTVQQVQAHEAGTSPIVASRLDDLAQLLGVSVSFLFRESSGISGNSPYASAAPSRQPMSASRGDVATPDPRTVFFLSSLEIDADYIDALIDLPSADEVWRLVRQFSRIADPDLRAFAIDQMEAMTEHRPLPSRRDQS